MFRYFANLFFPEMPYTVLYTCTRNYKCFRTVYARTEAEAAARCREMTPNFAQLTEVRPYVGGNR